VASERSGTTLLRLMLDHHPQIAFHHEAAFLVEYLPSPGSGWPAIEEYHAKLQADRIFEHSRFEIDRSLDYVALVNSFLEQKRSRDGKTFVGATVHHAFDRLLDIWPHARFIHLVRDPRDVARSVVQMGWAGNVYEAASVWLEAEAAWDRLLCRISPQQFIEIRYGDLIRNHEATLDAICRFIGVEYHPAMLEYADHTTYDLPDPSLIEQWRTRMTEKEIRLVESRVDDRFNKYGFERSARPPLRVSSVHQFWLKTHSRIYRALFRFRRYGLSLYVQDLLSRRLRIKPWQSFLRPRLRAIDEQFIK